eukprot:9686559-Ditylum_brightwellii.AAC.1
MASDARFSFQNYQDELSNGANIGDVPIETQTNADASLLLCDSIASNVANIDDDQMETKTNDDPLLLLCDSIASITL